MNKVMGGSLPAQLWRDVMLLAHEGRPPTALPGMPAYRRHRASAVPAARAGSREQSTAADAARADRRRVRARASTSRGRRARPIRRQPPSRSGPVWQRAAKSLLAASASGREVCAFALPRTCGGESGRLLRGVAVQLGALVAQPVFGLLEPRHGAGDQLPEARAVVHLDAGARPRGRRHSRERTRGQDEAPGERQQPVGRA